MPTSSATRRRRWWPIVLDVIAILAIGLAAQAGHFAQQQGRAVICGDSAQHVDGAESLLSPDQEPNFGLRKPGYTLILAALAALTGHMSWPAIAANHLLLGLLPVIAYGLGLNLRSRSAGWVAAILTIAQLQTTIWGARIMSEASYTCLISLAVLVFVVGLSRPRLALWMFAAGALFAYAWLVRSVGVAMIVAAVGVAVWSFRATPRRALIACTCLLAPVGAALLVECGLNLSYSGRFSPSTGGSGVMLLVRARSFQGSEFPDTASTRRLLELVPERSPDDAYLVNKLDSCVARCRAIRDEGMDEWSFNSLATRAAMETIAADPKAYLKAGAAIAVRHLLRQKDGPPISSVPRERLRPIIAHETAPDTEQSQNYWYAYWFLPHRSVEASRDLVERMKTSAQERAPFGRTGFWATLRYLTMLPLVVDVMGVLRSIASLWPGFALIGCSLLGLNRRTCALLAMAYVLEAGILAVCGATDIANERYQFVWLATDTALVACLVAPAVDAIVGYVRSGRHERTLREEHG